MLESFISRYLHDQGIENERGKCKYLTRSSFFFVLFGTSEIINSYSVYMKLMGERERKLEQS